MSATASDSVVAVSEPPPEPKADLMRDLLTGAFVGLAGAAAVGYALQGLGLAWALLAAGIVWLVGLASIVRVHRAGGASPYENVELFPGDDD